LKVGVKEFVFNYRNLLRFSICRHLSLSRHFLKMGVKE